MPFDERTAQNLHCTRVKSSSAERESIVGVQKHRDAERAQAEGEKPRVHHDKVVAAPLHGEDPS